MLKPCQFEKGLMCVTSGCHCCYCWCRLSLIFSQRLRNGFTAACLWTCVRRRITADRTATRNHYSSLSVYFWLVNANTTAITSAVIMRIEFSLKRWEDFRKTCGGLITTGYLVAACFRFRFYLKPLLVRSESIDSRNDSQPFVLVLGNIRPEQTIDILSIGIVF